MNYLIPFQIKSHSVYEVSFTFMNIKKRNVFIPLKTQHLIWVLIQFFVPTKDSSQEDFNQLKTLELLRWVATAQDYERVHPSDCV